MSMSSYDAGEPVIVSVAITVAGTPTNPSTITCTLQKPDGTTQAVPVTAGATGTYTATVDTTGFPRGVCRYKWAGTGTAQGAADGSFYVNVPF